MRIPITFLRTFALIASLVHANVAYGQGKLTYTGKATFIQIISISSWAPEQCPDKSLTGACIKEALELIHDMHDQIVLLGEFNATQSAATRETIERREDEILRRFDKWAAQFGIRAVRVSTDVAK